MPRPLIVLLAFVTSSGSSRRWVADAKLIEEHSAMGTVFVTLGKALDWGGFGAAGWLAAGIAASGALMTAAALGSECLKPSSPPQRRRPDSRPDLHSPSPACGEGQGGGCSQGCGQRRTMRR